MNGEMKRYIANKASRIGVQPAALQAVIAVESAGSGFTDKLVTIRWEGHYFWRLLPKSLKNIARSKGLADPRAQAVKNPSKMRDRHKLLVRAMKVHPEFALKSISMGMGQVMGSHAEKLGYRDVFEMWESCHTWQGQVDCMIHYIERFGLKDELQRLDWAGFARGYNGPNYRKFAYDRKMRDAYVRFSESSRSPIDNDPSIRMGDRRSIRVIALQKRLSELGHHVAADGDFGPATKRAVQSFQLEGGMKPDGIVGPQTQAALDSASTPLSLADRESTTAGELSKRSRIARDASLLQKGGVVVASSVGGLEVAESTGVLDKISEHSDKLYLLQSLSGPLQTAKEFISDNLWVVAVIAGVAVAVWGTKIMSARLDDHRTGKTT